jgi:hypothetical protein
MNTTDDLFDDGFAPRSIWQQLDDQLKLRVESLITGTIEHADYDDSGRAWLGCSPSEQAAEPDQVATVLRSVIPQVNGRDPLMGVTRKPVRATIGWVSHPSDGRAAKPIVVVAVEDTRTTAVMLTWQVGTTDQERHASYMEFIWAGIAANKGPGFPTFQLYERSAGLGGPRFEAGQVRETAVQPFLANFDWSTLLDRPRLVVGNRNLLQPLNADFADGGWLTR